MTAANLVAYSTQIAVLVLACATLPRLLGLRSPGLQYLFWRSLLALSLVLPIVEPWHTEQIVLGAAVPAIASSPLTGASMTGTAGASASLAALVPAVAGVVLLVGIAARLAWLSLGVVRLRRLRRRAKSTSGAFRDLQQRIGTSASILWSHDVRQPVTFGVVRPVVLLPAALASVDDAAQRAVVAHELHHVKRRDWAWVVGEEFVRSVFWFHPAVWWLISRVQLARETVVDELSILTTNARRAYLDALLAFAGDGGLGSTPAFSARRQLFHRVMLLSKEGKMSTSRIALACCVLVAALGAGSWGVVRAFPLATIVVVPDVAPQPSVIRDAALQQAVERWNRAKDTSLPREQRRRLLDMGILEVDHALSIDPNDRDALVWKNVMLRLAATLTDHDEARAMMLHQPDELRDKTIALMKQSAPLPQTRPTPGQLPPPPPPPSRDLPRSPDQSTPPPPPPPPTAGTSQDIPESFRKTLERLHPVRVGAGVTAPIKIKDVRPRYPDEAMAARIEGEITLETIVDPDGRVADVRVIQGVSELNDAALSAVRQWEFKPAVVNGEQTSVIFTCVITFHLR